MSKLLFFSAAAAFALTNAFPAESSPDLAPLSARAVVTDLPYNFTLAAHNVTLPNSNTTGSPLVLGQNGAIDGAEFEVTSTWASYPYDDFPTIRLKNASLNAFFSNGEWITNATETLSGGTLGWLTTSFEPPYAATIYSAVSSPGHKFPHLAVYGHSDLWSLCPFSGGQVNVVYNVSADTPPPQYLGFNPAQCYAVSLNIVKV